MMPDGESIELKLEVPGVSGGLNWWVYTCVRSEQIGRLSDLIEIKIIKNTKPPLRFISGV